MLHLNNYINRHDLLIDWIIETLPDNADVLDVGANDGSFCPEVRRIAEKANIYSGVDPDSIKLDRHPFLAQRFNATLEEADIPNESFDCIYSIYVFEHVADSERFINAAARILRPGGSLFFITPNKYHYFAFIAGLCGSLGIQEKLLRILRPDSLVSSYHYPALYRLNSSIRLKKLGLAAGFDTFEFRYSENFREFSCYFPGPLKLFPWLWEKAVQLIGQERLLGNLMGRMIKRVNC